MLIKRKNLHDPGSGKSSPLAGEAAPRMPEPVADFPDWTEETVASGLAPERRKADRRNDRRREYRRVEDRGLISKAHEEANAIRENARNQGFEEGLERAREAIEELRTRLVDLMNGRDEALLSVAGEIGPLAVEVAARLIKTEVSCDETLVMAVVLDTIRKAGRDNKSILLKLSPDDLPSVKKILKDQPIPNLNAELILMEDPGVDPGSCIVETNSGLIDATFTTQLGILRRLIGNGPA